MTSNPISEIDVFRLLGVIGKRRGVFLTTIAGCFLMMVLYLHVVPVQYTVSMTIAPVTENNSQLNGSLGALARLGGVNVSNITGGAGQFQLFVNALNSRVAADYLARDQHLMREMYPHEWSVRENRWKPPSRPLHYVASGVENMLGISVEPWHQPSGEDVYTYLEYNLQVDDDSKMPTITLNIQSDKPEVAQELLTKLTTGVDAILRQRALNRANDYIAYLTKELDKVTVTDYRAALIEHLAEQEQIRMMASANVSFAAQVFSGPSRSTKPTAPKSLLLLFFSLAVGALLGARAAVLAERQGWTFRKFSFWPFDRLLSARR